MMSRASRAVCVLALAYLTMSAGVASAKQDSGIELLNPAPNAVITQNDPATGCGSPSTYGSGFMIKFQWSDSKPLNGLRAYKVTIQHAGSVPDTFGPMRTTSLNDVECNSFVLDQNLSNWTWQVSLINPFTGKVLGTSEKRPFSFAPCRLAGGQACSAP
jgi:hypothetical protein